MINKYNSGSIFAKVGGVYDGDRFILVRVDFNNYALVNLETGNLWDDSATYDVIEVVIEEAFTYIPKNDNTDIKKIANEVAELVAKKNADYGDSFTKTMDEYGETAYFLRIEDKLSRLKSLSKNEQKVNDESVTDTLKDIIGYTLLMINYKINK